MEIPELLSDRLGDESVAAAVDLGGDDIVCFTETRTLVYEGEGLLTDESVSVYEHDIERLDLTTGRRKATFELAYVDRTESFSVPAGEAEAVLARLLAGVLGAWGVTESDETVVDAFRFSELTVVITDRRLAKHVGASVWGPDYEQFPYGEVTGLEFEEGQVATQLVLSSGGRPHRIKAPSDDAAVLREALTTTLCAYHGVDSIAELNERTEAGDSVSVPAERDGLELDEGIAPLVETGGDEESDGPNDREDPDASEHPDQTATERPTPSTGTGGSGAASARPSGGADPDRRTAASETDADGDDTGDGGGASDRRDGRTASDPLADAVDAPGPVPEPAADGEADVAALRETVAELTEAVNRQSELLERQQQTIERLVEQLR